MVPLKTASVLALLSCTGNGECGWYRGRNAFRPDCWDDGQFLFLSNLLGGKIIMKEQLELIRANALAALEAAETPPL